MKHFAYNFLARLPFFKWLFPKLVRYERELAKLRWEVGLLKAQAAYPRKAANLKSLLALLKPRRPVGIKKIRLGSTNDGGYIMLDDLSCITQAYSLGIANEVTWDIAMAGLGIPIEQYDYSIRKTPVAHPKFTFHRTEIKNINDIKRSSDPGQILKIDIDSSEWDFFESVPAGELSRFKQILGEFHDFQDYHDDDWHARTVRVLRKILATHELFHVHANNGGGHFWAGDALVPCIWELSFALRSQYQFEDETGAFPSAIDAPNLPDRADYEITGLILS